MPFDLNNKQQPTGSYEKLRANHVIGQRGSFPVLDAGTALVRTLVSNVNTTNVDHETFVEDVEISNWWSEDEVKFQVYSTASVTLDGNAGVELLLDSQSEGIGIDFWVDVWDRQEGVYVWNIAPFLNINMPDAGTEGQTKTIVVRRHSDNVWWYSDDGVSVRLNLGGGKDAWFSGGDGGFNEGHGDLVISTLYVGGQWVVTSSNHNIHPTNIWSAFV